MSRSRFSPGAISAVASRLPSTLHLIKTDRYAKQIWSRLNESKDAKKALIAIAHDERTLSRVVLACIEAEHLKRTFPKRITAAQTERGRLRKLAVAEDDLRKFAVKIAAGPGREDQLPHWIIADAAEAAAVLKGLDRLQLWIASSLRIADDIAPQIGATRKARMPQAAETAAIGWLASAIQSA